MFILLNLKLRSAAFIYAKQRKNKSCLICVYKCSIIKLQ
nr:MAG TPA: hypothetical protein [Caudoviricetes sp.]